PIEPLPPERVDGEEAARHDACGLLAQERRPGATRPPRRRGEPVAAQRRPDRGRRDAHAEPKQFALDALVAPAWLLPAQADNQLLHLLVARGPRPAARG